VQGGIWRENNGRWATGQGNKQKRIPYWQSLSQEQDGPEPD